MGEERFSSCYTKDSYGRTLFTSLQFHLMEIVIMQDLVLLLLLVSFYYNSTEDR